MQHKKISLMISICINKLIKEKHYKTKLKYIKKIIYTNTFYIFTTVYLYNHTINGM